MLALWFDIVSSTAWQQRSYVISLKTLDNVSTFNNISKFLYRSTTRINASIIGLTLDTTLRRFYIFLAWHLAWCLLKLLFQVYLAWQKEQVYTDPVECAPSMCSFKWELVLKLFTQTGHWYNDGGATVVKVCKYNHSSVVKLLGDFFLLFKFFIQKNQCLLANNIYVLVSFPKILWQNCMFSLYENIES